MHHTKRYLSFSFIIKTNASESVAQNQEIPVLHNIYLIETNVLQSVAQNQEISVLHKTWTGQLQA